MELKVRIPKTLAGWFKYIILVTVVANIGLLTGEPVIAKPAPSEQTGKIAFVSYRDSNREIYVVNADGTEQKNLTNDPGWDHYLRWSPDGAKIAFISSQGGGEQIYVMNADGTGRKNLSNSWGINNDPRWSPDGTNIAFVSYRDGNGEIHVVNADGTGQKKLTNSPARDYMPQWSPDGKKIAFISSRDGNREIYVMNADGTEQRNLSNDPGRDNIPQWSPDGTRIAFQSYRDGNGEIHVVNADGMGQGNLSDDPGINEYPRWSPDGTRIAFRSNRDGNWEIYVMNADGTGQKNLTNDPGYDYAPRWSPDGTKIAFVSYRNGKYDIHIINADGTGQKNLSNDLGMNGIPQWSPDGTRIAFESRRDGNWEIYVVNADGTGQKNLSNDSGRDFDPQWSPSLEAKPDPKPGLPPQTNPIFATMTAPTSLDTNWRNALTPNPFTVRVDVRNKGDEPLQNVAVKFSSSPEGLTLEENAGYAESDTVNIGTLAPGEYRKVRFLVRAAEPREGLTYSLKAEVSADGIETVEKIDTLSVPDSRRTYVAIGDSTTTGHSIRDCPLGYGSYDYVYGCPVEPGDGPAYPDVLAKKLGSDYAYGYWTAEEGDYKAASSDPDSTLGPRYERFNRVGVWGYTIKQAVDEYGDGSGPDRRGDTPWESQLHAADEASKLVTVSLGANDMRQSDIVFWLINAGLFRVESEAEKLRDELTKSPAHLREASYMDRLFEVLRRADARGAKVVVNLYYNPFHEPYHLSIGRIQVPTKCAVTHNVAKTVTGTINDELRKRARENNLNYVEFGPKFNPEGPEDHGAGGWNPEDSWVWGTECDVDGVLGSALPKSWPAFDKKFEETTYQQIAEEFDPHPNPAGTRAMAEAIEEVVSR